MTIYFTSDTHFWHYNIISYCNRLMHKPEMDKQEVCRAMNEVLISSWNHSIGKNDEVYFLGDFAFCGKEKAIEVVERLNGIKYWIRGNHDHELAKKISVYFEWVRDYYVLRVPDKVGDYQYHQPIVLSHFPILSWENMQHGTWHLHGHCHGSLPDNPSLKRMDVGVDTNATLSPYSYEDIKLKLKDRLFLPVDHHGAK